MNQIFIKALVDMLGLKPPKATVTKGGKVVTGTGTARDSARKRANRQGGARTERKLGGRDRVTVQGQRNQSGPPRGAQGPRQPPVQGPYQRTSGLIGERPTTPSQPPRGIRGDRFLSSQGGAPKLGGAAAGGAASTAAGRSLLQVIAPALGRAALTFGVLEGGFPSSAADGTLDAQNIKGRKPYSGMEDMSGDPIKPQSKREQLSPAAISFDNAFAAARETGKKEFTWRGNRYHTRLK